MSPNPMPAHSTTTKDTLRWMSFISLSSPKVRD